jgi:cytochrome c biogenesis protein CcdA
MVEQLTLGLIIGAALADSINPCVFGVLIFLLAYMTAVFKKNKKKMLIAGLIYVGAVYITYLVLGLGIIAVAQNVGLSTSFYWLAAFIAIGAGLLEIKDFFWYGKGFSLQIIPGGAERIKHYTSLLKNVETQHPIVALGLAFLLGVFVVFVELPCTGAPYLAILGMLSSGDLSEGIPLLLLYNLIFIIPLFVIIALVYMGTSSKKMEVWRKEHRGVMRLGIGLFLIAMGIYMIMSIA